MNPVELTTLIGTVTALSGTVLNSPTLRERLKRNSRRTRDAATAATALAAATASANAARALTTEQSWEAITMTVRAERDLIAARLETVQRAHTKEIRELREEHSRELRDLRAKWEADAVRMAAELKTVHETEMQRATMRIDECRRQIDGLLARYGGGG